MRSDRVVTNLTCNQNCRFCTSRSGSDDRDFIRPESVRARIRGAVSAGAREIVLTGGEPTLRKDIVELVASARAAGAEQVVLESNATLIDGARAVALKEAGLSLARINVAGLVVPDDAVTRDEGGAARTIGGIRALMEAGVPVQLEVAVVASTLPGLQSLPGTLHAALGDLRLLRGLQLQVPVTSPDAAELVSYEDAAAAITALEDPARRLQLQLRLAPDSGPPPCVFKHQARVAHLFSMTAGATKRSDHVQVEACGRCQLADRCSGFSRAYLEGHALPALQPIGDDRMRRRLSLINTVEEQVQREFVQLSRYDSASGPVTEKLIRINFQCNQACRFCFVSTHLPTVDDAITRKTIRQAGEEGFRITLSGGEPTLNPHLVEYVKLAKASSNLPVNLQTNATRLSAPESVAALVEAGLDEAFVSLHGSTAEISDAVTETPGTFEKTVAGIDQLSRAPIMLILNFVICQKNVLDLVPYVQLVAARWPKALLNMSFVAPSSDVVPKETALIPPYSAAIPQITLALLEARRLGVKVVGFESMCGLPLCLVPAELGEFFSLTDIPDGFDAGEFVKTPVCQGCALQQKCYGVRRGYRDLYGDGELRAVVSVEDSPHGLVALRAGTSVPSYGQ